MESPHRGRHQVAPRTGRVLVLVAFAVGCLLGPALLVTGASAQSAGSGSTPVPDRFGFGRPATPEEIAALDIDVMPDGTGLPDGRGTVAEGRVIYTRRCGVCHGANGEGGLNDRLVGREPRDPAAFSQDPSARKTIGNYWPYATTLFDYTARTMPFTQPGSLSADEVYSVVAYLLYLNAIVGEDAVLNRETLAKVVMPAHDRFVIDDRQGGPRVR